MIDYELIDQDARVSAGNDYWMSYVDQASGDIEVQILWEWEAFMKVGVYISDCLAQ